MRQRALRGGLQSLAPHEIIELILFYAVPRRDVNGVAHALIDKFGSVGAVVSANKADLMSVRGVGERAADLFAALNECVSAYSKLPLVARQKLLTRKQTLEYINGLPNDGDRPLLMLTLINSGGEIVYSATLPADAGDLSECLRVYALERALKFCAAYVVIVLKNVFEKPRIDSAARDKLREISKMLAAVEILVLDYIVMTHRRAYSLRHMLETDGSFGEVFENAAVSETWLEEPGDVVDIYDSDE